MLDLRKFNRVPRQHSSLFLEEDEWRFSISTPIKLLVDLKKSA